MWTDLAHNAIFIAALGGVVAGWVSAVLYFRQRFWVMQQRLSDYSARRHALDVLEAKRLVCPVCKSRALRRSNKRSLGVVVGMALGRYPYRCERCFSVSLHRGQTTYALAKRIDTYESLEREREQFAADLFIARKMKRLYPEMFQPDAASGMRPRK